LSIAETIIAFAWEPNGSKFAVLHGEAPRISVSFYHVKDNGKIELVSKHIISFSRGGGRARQPRGTLRGPELGHKDFRCAFREVGMTHRRGALRPLRWLLCV
jgi:uncharacterized protein with WD repeat